MPVFVKDYCKNKRNFKIKKKKHKKIYDYKNETRMKPHLVQSVLNVVQYL